MTHRKCVVFKTRKRHIKQIAISHYHLANQKEGDIMRKLNVKITPYNTNTVSAAACGGAGCGSGCGSGCGGGGGSCGGGAGCNGGGGGGCGGGKYPSKSPDQQ